MRSAVEQEIRELIQKNGPITFARFMQACLYSPNGGFYSTRSARISAHFRTSATMHPVFGALLARQLEQMWHILGDPAVFHVVEAGSGDGVLAESIIDACRRDAPQFAEALYYVAADYQPECFQSRGHTLNWENMVWDPAPPNEQTAKPRIQRVKTEGVRPFRNVVGCILSNELIDNFPVHRFIIQDGRVKEVFVTLTNGNLTEVLDEPSSPLIGERLNGLGLSLPDGHRGEVNLALDDWTAQVSAALDRGFVITIDYGQTAADLYAPTNAPGTLVCFDRHAVGSDPYQRLGQQDITCQVDFTSLMRLGERHGLATVGYTRQSRFLDNLGFNSFLHALETQKLSAARKELSRMAMMTLVDPDEYGDFKALAQAKGVRPGVELSGFTNDGDG